MAHFKSIAIRGWRQFSEINIDLSSQVTILTGPNGCGKTTVLNILAKHFGWGIKFVAGPLDWGRKRTERFYSDIERHIADDYDASDLGKAHDIGEISYDDGAMSKLIRPASDQSTYAVKYEKQHPDIPGLIIPSHCPPTGQIEIKSIPTKPVELSKSYQQYQQLLFHLHASADRGENPGKIIKESLISLAMLGYGNKAVAADRRLIEAFEGFQEALLNTLPSNIGFKSLEIQSPDIILRTSTGDFPMDAMSGGVNAIFTLTWQIYTHGLSSTSFTIIIDEPENHLHPSMQRELLPSLSRAFPCCRFIVATHSPFIVSSHKDANVYGLVHQSESIKRIISRQITNREFAVSPNDVLRDILDVPSIYPRWVDDEIASIFQSTSDIQQSSDRAMVIYKKLKALGLLQAAVEHKSGEALQ